MRSSMLHVRVDEETKAKAAETLEAMGLSMSAAIRLFLHRVVVDQALPIDLRVPNADTRAAMAEAEELVRRRPRFGDAAALIDDLEEKRGQ
ncbi:DNA-damage-inducible protein J [Zavarzinia compransoris]|nr:DNA-damage-inducible protein J [Zavarzinia compransoris]